jgi:hypothetical protein
MTTASIDRAIAIASAHRAMCARHGDWKRWDRYQRSYSALRSLRALAVVNGGAK